MKRNCNLELQLFPFSGADLQNQHHESSMKDTHPEDRKQQQLTIFYDGNVCVCDVTEFQARTILLLASKEMEDKTRTNSKSSSEPASPSTLPSIYRPNNGLSMKRSLQRFLQKRNHRIQATYSYGINQNATCRIDPY